MKILVTGAYGYIGSHLCNALAVDNEVFKVGIESGVDLSYNGWTAKLPDEQFDCVIHLAQSLRYRDFPEGAADMLAVNVNATAELLEWSRKHGVKRFIFTSTGNVYKNSENPLDEEAETFPASFYAATKLAAENLAMQYSNFFNVLVLRLFGVYGPGQKNMLIPNVIEKVKNDTPVVLAGGEGIWLTPTYIDDVVYYLMKFVNLQMVQKFEIVNLSGSEKVSLGQITLLIANFLGKNPIVENTENKPLFFTADITKLIKMTGDHQFTPLNEGLRNIFLKNVG